MASQEMDDRAKNGRRLTGAQDFAALRLRRTATEPSCRLEDLENALLPIRQAGGEHWEKVLGMLRAFARDASEKSMIESVSASMISDPACNSSTVDIAEIALRLNERGESYDAILKVAESFI